MKPDLFDLADQNAKRLNRHYKEIDKKYRTENEKTVLEEFADFVKENWVLSINLKQSEINTFLISGTYQNMYQVIADDLKELSMGRGVDISKEEAAKNRMGIFYEKRRIFESQFKDSNCFIYAALNIGGIGLKKYGAFSLIIRPKEAKKLSSCAFLKKESILYVNDGSLDIEQLKNDTGNRETFHLLTALKNKKNIPDVAKKNWPQWVCNEKNYIETVTKDAISIEHIKTVRLTKKSYDMYFDYLYKAYNSRLDESEKRQLGAFKDMLKLLTKNSIDKEIIDEKEN